jgi:hypothetical protein
MKKLVSAALIASLVSFGASASDGWATRPVSANKIERNDRASLSRLVNALSAANVALVYDDEGKTDYCLSPYAHGKFVHQGDEGLILLCDNASLDDIVYDNLVHEVAHVIQWCANGKSRVKALGWKHEDYTLTAVRFATQGQYTGKQFAIEAEAQSFAETTSLLGAAKTVEKYCN